MLNQPLVIAAFACIALVPTVAAGITWDQLPQLPGDVFAMDLSEVDGDGTLHEIAGLIAIHAGHMTQATFYVETQTLVVLSNKPVETITPGSHWVVYVDEAHPSVHIVRSQSGCLLVGSSNTPMLDVDVGSGLGDELSDAVATCGGPMCIPGCITFECTRGCCRCCVCFHRCAGIPEFMDNICCFYSGGC